MRQTLHYELREGTLAVALIVLSAAVSWSGTDASGRAITAEVHAGDGSFKGVDTATGAIVAELRARTPEFFPELFIGAAQRW